MSGSGRASRAADVDLSDIAEAVLDALVILDASSDARRKNRPRVVGGVKLTQALEALAAGPVAAPPPLDVLEAGLHEIEQIIVSQKRQFRRSPLARLFSGLGRRSRSSTAAITAGMKASQQLLDDVRRWQRAIKRYSDDTRPPSQQPALAGARGSRGTVSAASTAPDIHRAAKPAKHGKSVAAKTRGQVGLQHGTKW